MKHNASIVDQFTKQSDSFAEMPGHSDESAFQLMIELSGVTSKDNVLDVACGPGLVSCAFATKAAHVTGIDITPAMIDKAKKIQNEKGLRNMDWEVGDVLPLPYLDESFSLVITRYSFHHFLDPFGVFKQMHRACKKGGTIMVVDAAVPVEKRANYDQAERLRDPSHTSACTPQELLAMAENLSLNNIAIRWYKLEVELEKQIKASFPDPGNDEKLRELFRQDIGKDNLGMGVHLQGSEIHFAYPTLILVGRRSAANQAL